MRVNNARGWLSGKIGAFCDSRGISGFLCIFLSCGRECTHITRLFSETGVEFSGGERQQLGIARAAYQAAAAGLKIRRAKKGAQMITYGISKREAVLANSEAFFPTESARWWVGASRNHLSMYCAGFSGKLTWVEVRSEERRVGKECG